MELGQETIQSKNEVLPFLWIMETIKKCKQTNKHQIFNLKAAVSRFSQLISTSRRMNTSWEVLPGKKPILHRFFFLTLYLADLPQAWLVINISVFFFTSNGKGMTFYRIGPLGRFDLAVAMFVCASMCLMSLFMWGIFRPILPPLPEIGCPNFLEIRNL